MWWCCSQNIPGNSMSSDYIVRKTLIHLLSKCFFVSLLIFDVQERVSVLFGARVVHCYLISFGNDFFVFVILELLFECVLCTWHDLFIVDKFINFHILDLLPWVVSIPFHTVCVFDSFSTKQIQSTATKLIEGVSGIKP